VNRSRLAALSAGAMFLIASVFVPAVVSADTGNTNTIKVLNAPTINPPATGGNFDVQIVANGSQLISGAGAGLGFDKAKLQVTALAKDATEIANGVTYLGFPSSGGLAAFIATANTNGQVPNISWAYLDGSSTETANADHGIYTVSFHVIALGDSTLTPNASPTLLDGRVATYGNPLLPVTTTNGNVVNSAPPAPPTGAITVLPAWVATNTVAVKWGGTPGTKPIATYDVRYRKAAYSATLPATYTLWKSATALTTANFTTVPGTTYCFSELARDNTAAVSAWTAETCTAAPLDDRSFARAGAWSLKTGSAYYRSTYLLTTTKGAKLTRTGVVSKHIVLVATTCPTCGTVQVFMGTKLLKTVSLKSTTTVNKKLITITTTAASGTLSIKVYTSGKKVMIDGVVISAK